MYLYLCIVVGTKFHDAFGQNVCNTSICYLGIDECPILMKILQENYIIVNLYKNNYKMYINIEIKIYLFGEDQF